MSAAAGSPSNGTDISKKHRVLDDQDIDQIHGPTRPPRPGRTGRPEQPAARSHTHGPSKPSHKEYLTCRTPNPPTSQ